MLIGGLSWASKRWDLWSHGVEAQAQVIENQVSTSTSYNSKTKRNETSTSYYPIVKFEDSSGASHTFKGSTGSSSPDFSVGDKVPVLYMAGDPSNAQIKVFTQFWLGPVVISAMGLIFFAIGFIIPRFGSGIDSAFKGSFFAQSNFKPGQGGSFGQYRKVETLITKVTSTRNEKQKLLISLQCKVSRPLNEERAPQNFVSAPMGYQVNGVDLNENELATWQGKKVFVIYDSKNPADFNVEIFELIDSLKKVA